MNKQIQELAEQAGMVVGSYANDGSDVWMEGLKTPGALEKFAELIVEECRNVVSEVYRNTPLEICGPLLTADEEIAKHFYGVEE
jgi:hypothetical protein